MPAQGGLALNIPLLESRVTSLESLMADLIEVSYRTQRNVDQLAVEIRRSQPLPSNPRASSAPQAGQHS